MEADPFLEDPALDPANLTAPQLLEAMRRSFDIDETVSFDADARKIAAVRWELALRRNTPLQPISWLKTWTLI